MLREVRLPYFDRDLLEFMYAIPRDQIVRRGQRRSLMKRALVGIVPDELLKRRRKTFTPQEPNEQGPREESSAKWPSAVEMGQQMVSSSVQFIDSYRFLDALQKARRGEEVSIDTLMSTLTLEFWLRHLMIRGVLTTSMSTKRRNASHHSEPSEEPLLAPLRTKDPQARVRQKSSAS
jgi:asparagine synthase (glutamine-hydrolysing)